MGKRTAIEVLLNGWVGLDDGRNMSALEQWFDAAYVRHAKEGAYGRDQLRDLLVKMLSGFPDLHTEIADSVAEDDRVAWRWVATGTHGGDYRGVPPTGKRLVTSGITITRVAEGKIVEEWASWNSLEVLHTIGIMHVS